MNNLDLLKHAIENLASSAKEQECQLKGSVVADELLLDFDDAYNSTVASEGLVESDKEKLRKMALLVSSIKEFDITNSEYEVLRESAQNFIGSSELFGKAI